MYKYRHLQVSSLGILPNQLPCPKCQGESPGSTSSLPPAPDAVIAADLHSRKRKHCKQSPHTKRKGCMDPYILRDTAFFSPRVSRSITSPIGLSLIMYVQVEEGPTKPSCSMSIPSSNILA